MSEVQEISQVTSEELKYRSSSYLHPKQKFQQLQPFSGNQPKVIGTGGGEIIFQLSNKVMNLSKSILEFTITPNAGGANFQNVKYVKPLAPIRQIQLYSQSGVYLCDLYHVNKYLDVVYYPETSLDDFLSNEIQSPQMYFVAEGVPIEGGQKTMQTQRSNLIANSAKNYGINQNRISIAADGAFASVSETNPTINYTEKLYYYPGSVNATNPIIKISFPLKYIYNTIFSVDKNIYMGEILNLRFVFADTKDIMYKVNVKDESGGGGVDVPGVIVPTTAAKMSSDVTLTADNFYIYLAVENDLEIARQIIERVNTQGLMLNLPYVYAYKTNFASGTNQSLSLRFNRAHGKKLKKIYHAPCHGKEETVYNYVRDNVDGVKTVDYYYTLLNNDRMQEFNIKCSEYKDWQLHRHKLLGSSIQSVQEYQYGWFHCDDFTGEQPLCSKIAHDNNLSSGIDLNVEQKWDIYLTMNNDRSANGGITHYNFAITEKELIIRPGQIMVA